MALRNDALARRIGEALRTANREFDRLRRGADAANRSLGALTRSVGETSGGVDSLQHGLGAVSERLAETGFDLSRSSREGRTGTAGAFARAGAHPEAAAAARERFAPDANAAARAAARSVEHVFGVMEDALADFAETGRLSFSDLGDALRDALAQAFVTDFAVPALRQAVIGPVAGALGSALGSLFGGGGASAVPTIFHTGGEAGAPGGRRREVPAALFAAAPRYHGGGVAGLRADEVPAILQRGETVLPRGQGAAPPVVVNFENRGTPQRQVSSRAGFDGRGWIVDVVVDDVESGGALAAAIQRATGARAAAV